MKKVDSLIHFDDLVKSEKPIVLYFSASWCPDCQFISTFIDDIMSTYQEFDFYTVDIDAQKAVCEKADVMGIPSFVVYQNGKVVADFVSNERKTKEQIEDFLKKVNAAN